MNIYAYNSSYSEEFDPYFVQAETAEEARAKIREAYPTRIFSEYKMEVLNYPGISGKDIKGIMVLNSTGFTLR